MSEQGTTYTTFIELELKAERDRRTAFDARGASIVTTSSGMVALVTAILAFLRLSGAAPFPKDAKVPLALAFTSLAAAAAAGVLANWNRLYAVPSAVTLDRLMSERWAIDDEVDSRNHVGSMQVWTIDSLRQGNNWKARLITLGLCFQLVSLAALSSAALIVISR